MYLCSFAFRLGHARTLKACQLYQEDPESQTLAPSRPSSAFLSFLSSFPTVNPSGSQNGIIEIRMPRRSDAAFIFAQAFCCVGAFGLRSLLVGVYK